MEMGSVLVAQAVPGRDGGLDYGGGNTHKKQAWIQNSGLGSDALKT